MIKVSYYAPKLRFPSFVHNHFYSKNAYFNEAVNVIFVLIRINSVDLVLLHYCLQVMPYPTQSSVLILPDVI